MISLVKQNDKRVMTQQFYNCQVALNIFFKNKLSVVAKIYFYVNSLASFTSLIIVGLLCLTSHFSLFLYQSGNAILWRGFLHRWKPRVQQFSLARMWLFISNRDDENLYAFSSFAALGFNFPRYGAGSMLEDLGDVLWKITPS